MKMTASKHRHIPPLLRAYFQLHTHSTPPLTVHGHNVYGHTCSMTPVVILPENAGSNEPQGHAYFPYSVPCSVGLKRVVESEGGVWALERQRRACGWLESPSLAHRRDMSSLKASGLGDDEGATITTISAVMRQVEICDI